MQSEFDSKINSATPIQMVFFQKIDSFVKENFNDDKEIFKKLLWFVGIELEDEKDEIDKETKNLKKENQKENQKEIKDEIDFENLNNQEIENRINALRFRNDEKIKLSKIQLKKLIIGMKNLKISLLEYENLIKQSNLTKFAKLHQDCIAKFSNLLLGFLFLFFNEFKKAKEILLKTLQTSNSFLINSLNSFDPLINSYKISYNDIRFYSIFGLEISTLILNDFNSSNKFKNLRQQLYNEVEIKVFL